ncbi:Ribosome biogenesis protein brx1 [Schizosaccharomyces pombe]|uniref:Ribosome biogenesis protein brx1 n=1 Tax=Schizosaccharomyces pombe (strain 972 / ATCC 24843) TaxID=284812 RepID=BRX1_SCHPO|nr:ribosome biogenesis protein brx1 [Schizosaccharomyces pombe]Q9HGL6.1 RecName: Full=Ribosome biogenesis protein brx1 [Schizosaccharomyces pombe 972h-]8ESQ_A Chain A, Ribosome biogenesis protein brx1 [Schizosaccharomyces pombe]8ESR_A Chain A, Ribosome biogenesis protein brx1 [Schizosaccharomyces pombe]8ETG_A Chain A, Ribosome biogenesis protein brx1 [Schizosaccharomyces pombe]8ETH_A Chain A, Ribosome biogenesis protein brx1 [Schizosaccharomyces pombe]8ETI_A Chain A, Ribosome biogenesis prote|eukprot:NP_595107.1 ribosome biogenesis protein brx1 [Schizosaccharomyces pombe]
MSTVYKLKTSERAPKNEDEDEEYVPVQNGQGNKHSAGFVPIKQKVLVLSSRGVTYRQRHLLNDLVSMMPHSKKDSKLDSKDRLYQLNELAELYNCNNIFFFESRRREDLYLHIARAPNGPTVKFHVENLHTMDELNMTGNALKGSRPILSFDKTFDTAPHLKVVKELLQQTFGIPKGARRSKPFIDRVCTLTIADGKIWFRNYEIRENEDKSKDPVTLIEIGPRFVMTIINILEGSFGGPVIYKNDTFVSSTMVRAAIRNQAAQRYVNRQESKLERQVRAQQNVIPEDPLDNVFA